MDETLRRAALDYHRLPRPGKIACCIGNYWEHDQREARPLNMFLKNPDAVVGPGDTIHLPALLVSALGVQSSSEARRLLAQGGVKLDGSVLSGLDVPRAERPATERRAVRREIAGVVDGRVPTKRDVELSRAIEPAQPVEACAVEEVEEAGGLGTRRASTCQQCVETFSGLVVGDRIVLVAVWTS